MEQRCFPTPNIETSDSITVAPPWVEDTRYPAERPRREQHKCLNRTVSRRTERSLLLLNLVLAEHRGWYPSTKQVLLVGYAFTQIPRATFLDKVTTQPTGNEKQVVWKRAYWNRGEWVFLSFANCLLTVVQGQEKVAELTTQPPSAKGKYSLPHLPYAIHPSSSNLTLSISVFINIVDCVGAFPSPQLQSLVSSSISHYLLSWSVLEALSLKTSS